MKPETHILAKEVKTTIGGAAAKLTDIEKVSREAQEPMPGCGCKHGVRAILSLAANGKTVTTISVLEVTNELLGVDVDKKTVTILVPDYLRPPLQLNLGGETQVGQPKLIATFTKRQPFNLSKDVKIDIDGKAAQLSYLQKVCQEAGKPDPDCGCLPPGPTVTLILSDDLKMVTEVRVQPKTKVEADQKKPVK